MPSLHLGTLTTEECAVLVRAPHPVVLLPVGSTEPHGPHLPLATDAVLSEAVCERAARSLREGGVTAVVAPTLPYGVTRYAAGFVGAISLSPDTTERVIAELATAYLAAGFARVCVVNHHLEPEHVDAITRAVERVPGAIFANHLTRRWGRTLSTEFRRGDCHAGSYETSLVMAARPELVHDAVRQRLAPVPISLSQSIREGKRTFVEMGGDRAYFGSPAEASVAEGESLYTALVTMVVTEVRESLNLEEPAS